MKKKQLRRKSNTNKKAVEDYSDEFKAELDRRHADYKKDGAVVAREELDKMVKDLLYHLPD